MKTAKFPAPLATDGARGHNRKPAALVPGSAPKSAPAARSPRNPVARRERRAGRCLTRPAASGGLTPETGWLTSEIARLTLKIVQLTPEIVQVVATIVRLTLEIVQLTPEIVQVAAAIGGLALGIVQLAPGIGQVAGAIGGLAAAGRGGGRAKTPFAAGGGTFGRGNARPARNFLAHGAKISGKCRACVHLCGEYLTPQPPCLIWTLVKPPAGMAS